MRKLVVFVLLMAGCSTTRPSRIDIVELKLKRMELEMRLERALKTQPLLPATTPPMFEQYIQFLDSSISDINLKLLEGGVLQWRY